MSVNYRLPCRNNVILSCIFILANLLAFACTASAQGYRVDGVTQARSGFPVAAVTIAVCVEPTTVTTTPCSTLATLYTDSTLATPCSGTLQPPPATSGGAASSCSNPLIADGLGNYHYYVASGRYALQFYGSGITAYAQRDQLYLGGQSFYDVRAFGAVGNDVANDTTAIQNALNSCQTNGGNVYFPIGTYKTTLTLQVKYSNCTLIGDSGAKIDFRPTAPFVSGANAHAIIIESTAPTSDRAITGTIAAGATSFVVTSAGSTADLVANDLVLIYILDPTLGDAVRIDFAQVASVAGTTVNVIQPIQQSFAPAGAQTLVFQRMNNGGVVPIENVTIRGLNVTVNIAGQNAGSAVVSNIGVYWSKGVWIEDNVLESFPGNQTTDTIATFRSQNVTFSGNRNVARGSAAQEVQAEFAETVDLTVDRNIWEAESSSAATTIATIDFGTARFTFTNNKINNSTNFGIFAYTGTHDGVISGNTVGLVSGQQKGTNFLGLKNVVVKNNIFLGPVTNAFAGSLCLSFVDDTQPSVTITSAGNVAEGNKCGTQNSFQTNYQVPNAGDLLIYDDGSGNAVINHKLSVGGGANPATTGTINLSLPDSICFRNPANSADNCFIEDASGAMTFAGVPLSGAFTKVNATPVTSNTNTTADQNLMAVTITAGALNSLSRTLLVQLAGVYSTPAGSTAVLTHKLKLCTVSGCGSGTVLTLATWTTAALGAIQVTNDPYNAVLNASTQTAGASAAFEAHGNLTIDLSALTTAAEVVYADNNTATVGTINATAQLFLQHSIAFNAASASNSATDRQMIADTVD